MYPENLVEAINKSTLKMSFEEAEKIIEELSYKQKTVLLLYYKDGKTLRQIGSIFGISGERIRQIREETLRILRKKYLKKEAEKKLASNKPLYSDKIRTIATGLQCASILERQGFLFAEDVALCPLHKLMAIDGVGPARIAEIKHNPILNKIRAEAPLENIGLNTRAYNAIKRHGCNYVRDVAHLSLDDMLKMRNLGIKSSNELYANEFVEMVRHFFKQ